MDAWIIVLNYSFALSQANRLEFPKYFACAVRGILCSLIGAWACKRRVLTRSTFKAELQKGILFAAFIDTTFYWFHRLLHTGWLYKHHKLHHAAVIPNAADGIVASPLDVILTGSLPFFGAVWLLRPHVWVYRCLLVSGIPFLLIAHTKFDQHHMTHHKQQSTNFGNTRVWDIICGTLAP